MEPYINGDWDDTTKGSKGLYSDSGNATKIIQLNNWKIPKDYPFWK